VHEITHRWQAAGWLFAGIVLTALLAGLGAGREGFVLQTRTDR